MSVDTTSATRFYTALFLCATQNLSDPRCLGFCSLYRKALGVPTDTVGEYS